MKNCTKVTRSQCMNTVTTEDDEYSCNYFMLSIFSLELGGEDRSALIPSSAGAPEQQDHLEVARVGRVAHAERVEQRRIAHGATRSRRSRREILGADGRDVDDAVTSLRHSWPAFSADTQQYRRRDRSCVIGRLAATFHGSPLRTGDADICPSRHAITWSDWRRHLAR